MSDSSLEEESLISQDDIDKLLDSPSIEEAEEKLEKGKDNSPDPDELGELSQDDIDNLLTGSSLDDSQEETREDSSGDEMGELSQDDIDGLIGGDDAGAEADERGELSQDDIDGLMGGNDLAADEDDGDDVDDVDMELISQNDIDQLMTSSAEDPNGISETQTNEAEMVSDDFVIDETDGLDVSACLITQETLDELIRNAPEPEDVSDPVVPDPVVPDPVVPDPVVLDEDIESPPVSLEDQSEEDLEFGASSDELEDLLDTDINDTGTNLGIPDGDDVSQDDIDALLQESDEDEDSMADEEDILISQDDIDTLLMAADQEDEDLLGDLMGDDMGDGMGDGDDGDDNFDDEDILDGYDEGDAGPGEDQVVLAGGEDDFPDEDGTGKPWGNWIKSKLVIATASAILVLGISVPIVYFLFFSQAPVQVPEKMSVQVVMEAPGRDIEVVSVDMDVTAAMDFKKSGNIILSDFVVLASDLSKDMAYVTADISIDYFDQRAYHEINDNLSFYRDLIYESIQKNLLGEKGNEVTQADLIWGIETSLKKVFPLDYIEKVSFKSFKAS
jgi:hypothetical protein